MVNIRTATTADATALLKIYAPVVLHTATSFETEIPTVQDFENRVNRILQKFPWIVCEFDDDVVGDVYASTHRERAAYQWTCECSVYTHPQFQRMRIGKTLYEVLFALLKQQGMVNVYAGITLPNDASVQLHESCGFIPFAQYDNIGYKLWAWHKVGWWKLQLNEYELLPPPPISFANLQQHEVSQIFAAASAKIRNGNQELI